MVDIGLEREAAAIADDEVAISSGRPRRAAAVEFGGWVFANGKRIGRIASAVGDPSSSAPPMCFVACDKHGGSCGKLVHLNARLDRASCLRWLRAWRYFGDSASHTNALTPNQAFVDPDWDPLVPDDVPAPALPRTLSAPVGPRGARAIPFGPWSISIVCPDGIASAWGGNCNDHQNFNCLSKRCKTSLSWGNRMTPDEARRRVKFWLLQGLEIQRLRPLDEHLNTDFRTRDIAAIPPESELDRLAEEEEDRRLAAGVRRRPF